MLQESAVGFYRFGSVSQIMGMGRTAWYAGIRKGIFPKPVKLGPRASGWPKAVIHELAERIEKGEIDFSGTKESEAPSAATLKASKPKKG